MLPAAPRAGGAQVNAALYAAQALMPMEQRISGSLQDRATDEEKLCQKQLLFGPATTDPDIRKQILNSLEIPRPYGPGAFDRPCIYEWFCRNWSVCTPNPHNGRPYPGGMLTQPEELDNDFNGGAGVLRLDTYTCSNIAGQNGVLVTETDNHSDPQDDHVPQHIHIPLLLWKANIATENRFMYEQVLAYLEDDAVCILEKETFLVGDAPAPAAAGADAAAIRAAADADTRTLGFRGWMVAPCKQRYVSFQRPQLD